MWRWLVVIFYPIAMPLSPLVAPSTRLDRFSALASGFIIFLVLWLGVLPRDLTWLSLEPRFAVPVTAYLVGLVVTALLMSWTEGRAQGAKTQRRETS